MFINWKWKMCMCVCVSVWICVFPLRPIHAELFECCTLTQVFYPVRSIEQMRKCVYMAHTHTASSFLIAFASNSSSLYRCASLLASLVLRVTLSIQFSDLMREHGCMSEIRATWIKRIFHNNICIFCSHLYATLLPFRLLLLFISIAITIPFFPLCHHPYSFFLLSYLCSAV